MFRKNTMKYVGVKRKLPQIELDDGAVGKLIHFILNLLLHIIGNHLP